MTDAELQEIKARAERDIQDAEFVAQRADILALVAEVKRLREELSKWDGSAECGPGLCECDQQ